MSIDCFVRNAYFNVEVHLITANSTDTLKEKICNIFNSVHHIKKKKSTKNVHKN